MEEEISDLEALRVAVAVFVANCKNREPNYNEEPLELCSQLCEIEMYVDELEMENDR